MRITAVTLGKKHWTLTSKLISLNLTEGEHMKKILDWNAYLEKGTQAAAEGIVMLRNENAALPLKDGEQAALFGRIQLHYYKSGSGSGGLVNVSKVIGITEGLIEAGVNVNQKLLDTYKAWEQDNPYDIGAGWGGEPWSQKEMPISDSLADEIAAECDIAIVVIGRTAGEEADMKNEKGSYLLSDGEEQMLSTVRRHFKRVAVILNTAGIIDMGFVEKYSPDAVLYVWHGGMTGGSGAARVLTGKTSPSGKLPDTIAKTISDYPSSNFQGDEHKVIYGEDIYVGYRYFETFAPERVLFPFGFGLSYTSFDISIISFEHTNDNCCRLSVRVKNTGDHSGKEVVQIYASAPQGKLGKSAKVLCAFEKTRLLGKADEQRIDFEFPDEVFSSYDDAGESGFKSCFVLEEGKYVIYAGTSCQDIIKAGDFTVAKTYPVKKCVQALAPVEPFKRMKAVQGGGIAVCYEDAPLLEESEAVRRRENLPAEIPYTGGKGIRLCDVRSGKSDMRDFIAQLSDYDLSCIIRGEGMSSPRVTPGTAAAFAGVTDSLDSLGIPAVCCTDGPSGMRLDCGTKAFSLPSGTLLASTFNRELISELFEMTGLEMAVNKIDCLLGPGMNIHRHPLNGRNFEYFSEDPLLTGEIAAAQLKGFHKAGVTGTIKHFCANNKETGRHTINSVVSERALREIYLKGFEIAVKKGGAKTIMTTYGAVNGLWTAGSYDLNTTILRQDWDFKGVVMTDWWSTMNRRDRDEDPKDFAAMAAAQNDIYMVVGNSADNPDNTLEELKSGYLSRGELQRNAANICRFAMDTRAMDRLSGCEEEVEIINRPKEEAADIGNGAAVYDLPGRLELCPDGICTDKGSDYIFIVDANPLGKYNITVTASAQASKLAQIPLTVFSMGTPCATFTFNGTDGKAVSYSCQSFFFSRYTTLRLYFAQSGLNIHSIVIELCKEQ